jgi:TonB-dependent SusC/RagA subfamily outer membrane receptor
MLGIGALALLLANPDPVAAQTTGSVRGQVMEASTMQPLVGAQVSVTGTQRGGLTDSNGNFLITGVPAGQVTVRVESIGYRSVVQRTNVAAGQTAVVNFELTQSAIGLDEIVVTGTAGRTTKRAIGNSVGSIKASEITEAAPISNVQQLLQGRTPGVTLFASSGVVGGSSRIRIRGASSLNAGNEPVVFIDGVRVQSGTASTEGNTAQGISLLESINPNDIESIEVIKGPAAATLYGAEAATGVIQIITKKGRPSEGLTWQANFEYGQVDWSVDRISTYWLCTDSQIDNPTSYPGCQVFDKCWCASTDMVNAVRCGSVLRSVIRGRSSASARSPVRATQINPRPCFAMKFTCSAVISDAAQTRSPSFSRSSSSATMTIFPDLMSWMASSIRSKGIGAASITVLVVPQQSRDVLRDQIPLNVQRIAGGKEL